MITAIIRAYWVGRIHNINRIIDDLKKGSLPPDKIIVWNNNKDISIKGFSKLGVETIDSSINGGDRSLFATSILTWSNYYYYIDDDTTVKKKTLENIAKYANENFVVGLTGKIVTNESETPYTKNAKNISGRKIKTPKKVNLLIGKGTILYSYKAVLRMLEFENRNLRNEEYDDSRELDILLSMSNNSIVVPATEEQGLRNLTEARVGYSKEKGHYKKRNDLTKKVLEI
jgi:hypothetical protein